MSAHPDVDRVATIIAEVSDEIILPRFKSLAQTDLHTKEGPHDIATIVDTEAEAALSTRLCDHVPGSIALGEEACSNDPSLLERLGGQAAWLIDPLDGTLNFASGLPLFGVMVAYVVGKETAAAWIYDPVNRRTAIATSHANSTLNGAAIALRRPQTLKGVHGAISVRDGDPALLGRIASRTGRIGSVFLYRCAAYEYLAILEGASHFSIYHRLMPWDHAAGTFLVERAGGVARRITGERYRPTAARGGSLLVAVDAPTWELLVDTLVRE